MSKSQAEMSFFEKFFYGTTEWSFFEALMWNASRAIVGTLFVGAGVTYAMKKYQERTDPAGVKLLEKTKKVAANRQSRLIDKGQEAVIAAEMQKHSGREVLSLPPTTGDLVA